MDTFLDPGQFQVDNMAECPKQRYHCIAYTLFYAYTSVE